VSDHGGVDGVESGGSGVSISSFNQNLLLKMFIIDRGRGRESHSSA
jgi:hypothetical protein